MPAGTFTLFGKNKDDLRINDLTGAVIKIAQRTRRNNEAILVMVL